ncbi:class I mannose-6-phosphate isomerase [Agriterribacter sp.]|uniref:class I mannose-6-phosphate isomerase n=1 Tax=Agriterribacter sp. TaxID=2821509 RepID=UPI002BE2F888|nr:class I mannose-6-phosphate isomerase [Agriterribacter sp.]HTN05744.1 class I mannose-6-phosphate isomerase [Agriterribacter sp.]
MYNSNFDKFPEVSAHGYSGYSGWNEITSELRHRTSQQKDTPCVIIIECYHGVLTEHLADRLKQHTSDAIRFVPVQKAMLCKEQIEQLVYPYVTDDPVFGRITSLDIKSFFCPERLEQLKQEIKDNKEGIICIYGTGASLVHASPDILVYADMPRWEIQLRFRRNEMSNLGSDNLNSSFSYQYKRAFFVDWRVCDKLKKQLLPEADYVLDTTDADDPKMIPGSALQHALKEIAHQPFRVVPTFQPGLWGGQWLKEVCDLERTEKNFAWGFDCVPEENSLLIRFDHMLFETPCINLVFFQPQSLLGVKVWEAFGAEFPIRFDFLDTMDGGNLSLQVHPLKEYIREKFGMRYTQDESYYFMDARKGSFVYLGLKEGIIPEQMISDLEAAQEKGSGFDADKYVEKWPIRKHDHVLIPAGTVHCSGANSVVLEISATPYIFTFKLWDWGRIGMDGKPRPISLKHGQHSIQWNRTTQWTKNNILSQIHKVAEGEGWVEEKTGLHEGSFIETRRHWFTGKVDHHTHGVVNILNLIEGREAIVESPAGAFKPFIVHYAETFIVPAAVGAYTIQPHGDSAGTTCGTIKAFVNTENLDDYHSN